MKSKTQQTSAKGGWLLRAAVLTALGGLVQGTAMAGMLTTTACTSDITNHTSNCAVKAVTGSALLPNGTTAGTLSVNVLGYVPNLGGTGAASVTQPGGPVLIVNQGDTVTVSFANGLTESSSMSFEGQAMMPDTSGVAGGGSKTYTFTASKPGTFIYEAGLVANNQHQVAMGLYGLLVVRPSASTNQAYPSADTSFTDEAAVLLSEIDPSLNNKVGGAATFDMRNYNPKYFLINGKVYPSTENINFTPATSSDSKVLLRYGNAGLKHHSMTLLGKRQSFIAQDGLPLTVPHSVVAEAIAPGQTFDALVSFPMGSAAGLKYALYDGAFNLHNNSKKGMGGMLTFLSDGNVAPPGQNGPATGTVTLDPTLNKGVVEGISATITDTSNITAAEYFVDTAPTAVNNGTGCSMAIGTASQTVTANGSIELSGGTGACVNLSSLTPGNHTVYVHGKNATTWGTANFAVFNFDTAKPTVSSLTITPSAINSVADVAILANASDAATGGNPITAAEYIIDPNGTPTGGTGTALTVVSGVNATVSGAIPGILASGLTTGIHTIAVRVEDAAGNWSDFRTVSLNVTQLDRAGPVTSAIAATPNPNNGSTPFNALVNAVRVSATLTDAQSNVAGGEAFLNPVDNVTNGVGVGLVPSDGAFDSHTENAYADIPLSAVSLLSEAGNPHRIIVRGKDSVGNWGGGHGLIAGSNPPAYQPWDASAVIDFWIDKSAPAISPAGTIASQTGSPANAQTPILGLNNTDRVVFSSPASAVDPVVLNSATGLRSNIASVRAFVDNAGTGFPVALGGVGGIVSLNLSLDSSILANIAGGASHTVWLQAQDAAGNIGTRVQSGGSFTLDRLFANAFRTAAAPYGWTAVAGTAARLSVDTTANMVGTNTSAFDAGTGRLRFTKTNNAAAYVAHTLPPAVPNNAIVRQYNNRFIVNPNGTNWGANGVTIFDLRSAAASVVSVQLRTRVTGGVSFWEARATRGNGGITPSTGWFAVGGADGLGNSTIELRRNSAGSSVQLWIDGANVATLSGVSTAAATQERLGVISGLATATPSGSAMYLDSFISSRTIAIGQ